LEANPQWREEKKIVWRHDALKKESKFQQKEKWVLEERRRGTSSLNLSGVATTSLLSDKGGKNLSCRDVIRTKSSFLKKRRGEKVTTKERSWGEGLNVVSARHHNGCMVGRWEEGRKMVVCADLRENKGWARER